MNNYQKDWNMYPDNSSWVCDNCETINTGDKCSLCGRKHDISSQYANYSDITNNTGDGQIRSNYETRKMPDKNNKGMMIWSIIVAVLLSRIAGVVAIIQTRRANAAISREEEQKHLHLAKVWNIVGCVVGAIIILSQIGYALASDSYLPPLDNAASVERKKLDEDTVVQSEYDSHGALLREVFIEDNGDGTTEYLDTHDSEGRIVKSESYENGQLDTVFTYNYYNGNDNILVTCYDGSGNILGTVVCSDTGDIGKENWNINDSEQILILKLCIIASFL